MRVTEVRAEHVIADLPDVVPLATLPDDYDTLICAAGFEDRAVHPATLLRTQGLHVGTAIVLDYRTNLADNSGRRDELLGQLRSVTGQVHVVDEEGSEAEFDRALRAHLPPSPKILFDISAASGAFILRVLRALFAHAGAEQVNLTIVYAAAGEYSPTEEEAAVLSEASKETSQEKPATLGLDFDADAVPQIIAAGGVHLDAVAERAVVICGFNADRVRASLDKLDTSFNLDAPHPNVMYIAGVPPRTQDQWRYRAMKEINDIPDAFQASTLYFAETFRLLEQAYAQGNHRSRLTVVPFGSKMQSVAVALFSEARPDVRVQLLSPVRYEGKSYSRGVGESFLLEFGDLQLIRARLRSIGSLMITEKEHLRPRTSAVVLSPSREDGC